MQLDGREIGGVHEACTGHVNEKRMRAQEIGAEDRLLDVGNDERPAKASMAESQRDAAGAAAADGAAVGGGETRRRSRGRSEVGSGSGKHADVGAAVNEKMSARGRIARKQ
jgi:hypothetical protein